jgi:hypothetical protein
MDIYPELKGKELGDAINGFKKYIGDDFELYALTTNKEDILNDFAEFYKTISN